MHVGIAYLRWRGKRSRHSRRMRTRNFTYLARGPYCICIDRVLCHVLTRLLPWSQNLLYRMVAISAHKFVPQRICVIERHDPYESWCYCSGSLEPESSYHDRDWIMELPMEADILTFTEILTPQGASVASCCSGSLESESSYHDRDWIMELPKEADILTFTGILTPEAGSVASCCPACRTYEIARGSRDVVICPIFMCLTVYEFSLILFEFCLFITIFILILNYVLIVTFWIFTNYKISILLNIYCFIWNYWIIYLITCLELFWGATS